MPYRWIEPLPQDATPVAALQLWPHRSLTPQGFVLFFGATAAMIALPLLAVLGSPVVWAVMPFFAVTFWGMWMAIGRNTRDAGLTEELRLSPDRISLSHRPPRGPDRHWEANPHWVRLHIHPQGGPVPDYLTLKGNGREVELGAFLSDEERRALYADLTERLARLR